MPEALLPCVIDLVDLEEIPVPLKAPDDSLSITDKAFKESNAGEDYTEALRKCIAKAGATGKSVWIPKGKYQIPGDIILPSNIVIQGAGMWDSILKGWSMHLFLRKRMNPKTLL